MPRFLSLFLQSESYDRWRSAVFNIATIENIGADKYANLSVPIPDLATQSEILKQVDKDSYPLNETIRIAEDEINSIRLFRQRLIDDVVRGEIDVQQMVSNLATSDDPIELSDAMDLEFTADDFIDEEVVHADD